MNRIFFTADLHIGHKQILKFMPNRPYANEPDTTLHDKWLIDLWRSTVDKKDTVYILGDLTFYHSEEARRLLDRLPGRKYLIMGNHDSSLKAHLNYFVKVAQILNTTLRLEGMPAMRMALCHYPLLDWDGKRDGTVMLHGHTHGTLDDYNNQSPDLRLDVGIDGALAKQAGGFIDLGTLLSAIELKISKQQAILQ